MPGYDHFVGHGAQTAPADTLDPLATKASAECGKIPKHLISSPWKRRRRYLPPRIKGRGQRKLGSRCISRVWLVSGRYDVQTTLIDPRTGARCDGLHIDRRNENKGAESTLSYLLGLVELRKFARTTAKENNNLDAQLIRSARRSGFYRPAQMPNVPHSSSQSTREAV
jgi:hypothetical protein